VRRWPVSIALATTSAPDDVDRQADLADEVVTGTGRDRTNPTPVPATACKPRLTCRRRPPPRARRHRRRRRRSRRERLIHARRGQHGDVVAGGAQSVEGERTSSRCRPGRPWDWRGQRCSFGLREVVVAAFERLRALDRLGRPIGAPAPIGSPDSRSSSVISRRRPARRRPRYGSGDGR